MFKVTKVNENRVDLEIHRGITSDEMTQGLDQLSSLSDGMTNAGLYYTIHEFEMPEFGALAVEFARLGEMFRLIGRFSKCAVVCEQVWLRNMAQFEGMLIPGLTIRGFSLAESEQAEAWLAEG